VSKPALSWRTVADKWSGFRRAFHGFDINFIASYGAEDIGRLIEDRGIIQNRRKVLTTIRNACEFERIAAEYGGFA